MATSQVRKEIRYKTMSVTDDQKYEELLAMVREIRAIVGAPPKAWLTPEEAGVHLGVATLSVYRYIRNGSIPHHRIPGSNLIRLHVDELNAWMREGAPKQTQITRETIRRLSK